MSEPYTGGCACGAIRYQISAEPMVSNHCQCRDCQHKSGTGWLQRRLSRLFTLPERQEMEGHRR